jgi:mRNA interferase HigB
MKVVGRERLTVFCEKYTDALSWIEAWLAEVQVACWSKPADIKGRYQSASFLANNTVIFNVKGNTYRLETNVAFKTQVLSITWIGPHAEYDRRNRKR